MVNLRHPEADLKAGLH